MVEIIKESARMLSEEHCVKGKEPKVCIVVGLFLNAI